MAQPFGGLPARFEPAGDSSFGCAVVLPGRAYPPSAPLLEFGRLVLLHHGWRVRQVWWDVPSSLTERSSRDWVCHQLRDAVAEERERGPATSRWLLMAKSLGTLGVCDGERAHAYVLLTPLLHRPDVRQAIGDASGAGSHVLLVGGTADPSWSGEIARQSGAETVEIEGADHGMVVADDPVATARAHVDVVRGIEDFLGRCAGLR